jgi:hypothetical protein
MVHCLWSAKLTELNRLQASTYCTLHLHTSSCKLVGVLQSNHTALVPPSSAWYSSPGYHFSLTAAFPAVLTALHPLVALRDGLYRDPNGQRCGRWTSCFVRYARMVVVAPCALGLS